MSITLLLLIFIPLHAVAENVTLTWEPNSELDLVGYVLYYKKQGKTQYLDSVVVGHTTSYTMSGLKPGKTYDFVLTAFDESGNESDFSAPVSASIPSLEPVEALSPGDNWGIAPLTIFFADTSTGSITAWAWDFGDGGTSSDQNPSHTFAAGTYTVKLTVTGPGGSATGTSTVTAWDMVTIMSASYRAGKLGVTATSTAGPKASVEVLGYGPMRYDATQEKFVFATEVDLKPLGVTVRSDLGGQASKVVH